MTSALSIRSLSAHYGRTQVLRDLDLSVKDGELVALLGASGCGKTTTLRLIAGFLQPSAGSIRLGDRDLTALPAHRRAIGLVFQNYALFPHLTVADNVAFGLKQRRVGYSERRSRALALLERFGLSAFADQQPASLSGGQKQRVALARALIIEPPLMMFDEPLSSLDAKLRIDIRAEIRKLQRANATTSLYVTHDQEEAFSISDRVAIMQAGKILQIDRPETLYRRPANAFVAGFVGFENLLALHVAERRGALVTAQTQDGVRLVLSQDELGPIPDDFVLACRADGLALGRDGQGVPATVTLRTYLGRAYQYRCATALGEFSVNAALSSGHEVGERVGLVPVTEYCCILKPEG